MKSPFFSVIISTFNRAELLLETVKSVFEQTLSEFELIVVDDGSIDNTKELLVANGFFKRSELKYIYQINSERGVARNNGIKNASGKYLVFLDSDDLMKPNHLEILKNNIIKNPDVKLFATRYTFFSEDKKNITKTGFENKAGVYSVEILLVGNPFAVNFCIQNDPVSLTPFEASREYATMEDWIFLIENIWNNKLMIIDESTILMREHSGRSMRSEADILVERRIKATKLLLSRVPLSSRQRKKLWAGTLYFSAVHYYIDSKFSKGISYWCRYVLKDGMSFFGIVLFFKLLVGKRTIQRVRNVFN